MSDKRKPLPSIPTGATWLRYGMEGIVLLMVALSPWAFGAVDPAFEYCLYAATGLLAILWGIYSIIQRRFLWFVCPAALSLALIFLLGVIQLVPLPSWVLAIVSPAASSLNHELRPTTPEVLSPGEQSVTAPWQPTISVYPDATRTELYRWLAVLILFAAVRNVIASTESMRRLAWVAFANGILLSIFALYQFFASTAFAAHPKRVVFGFETAGEAFGTFICRNHFPDYLNFCIGLGVSLLLLSSRSESDRRASRTHKAQALVEQTAQDETTFSILSFLHSPLQLWLSAGVAVMVCAVIASMSRGGVAALLIGVLATLALRGTIKTRPGTRLEFFAVPAILIIGFVAWLGINPLQSRLTNWDSSFLGDARIKIWKNILPLAAKFPVFGSGYGTLQYVEPLSRQVEYPGYQVTLVIDRAHNDYLEALVEGGVIRLALTVALVYVLISFGRRAMRRHEIRSPGRLALGALIGVIALAAHSVVDFGSSTPAIATIAAVVAAQLASMARTDPSAPPTESSKNVVALPLGGFGGVASAVALTLIAIVLTGHGSVINYVQDRRVASFQALHRTKPPNTQQAINQLFAAAEHSRYDANLRAELGQAYLDAAHLKEQRNINDGQRLVAAWLAAPNDHPLQRVAAAAAWKSAVTPDPTLRKELVDKYLKPGIRQMIAARDLCPLLARPQARLAAYAANAPDPNGWKLAQSDPTEAYWARAIRLAPYDAELLYFAGLANLQAGRADAAWDLWKRALERSPKHTDDVVAAALPRLGVEKMLQAVLPDEPGILLVAARSLGAKPEHDSVRRRILAHTRDVLSSRIDLSPENMMQLAQAHHMLGEIEPAHSNFKQAISRAPDRPDWRFEYAKFLYSLQTVTAKQEALEQVKIVLEQNQHYPGAVELRNTLQRELQRE